MTARRPRVLPLYVALALLAVFAMSALSGLHAAAFHHHDAPLAAFVPDHDDHETGGQFDGDSPVHLAAHIASQGVVAPFEGVVPTMVMPAWRAWLPAEAELRAGTPPPLFLRPPRA